MQVYDEKNIPVTTNAQTKRRHISSTRKTLECPFKVTLSRPEGEGSVWSVRTGNWNHEGHYPNPAVQLPPTSAEKDRMKTLKDEHQLSVAQIVSLMKEEGVLTTATKIHNILNARFKRENKSLSQSHQLMIAMSEDDSCIGTIRMGFVQRDSPRSPVDFADLVKFPGTPKWVQIWDGTSPKCGNVLIINETDWTSVDSVDLKNTMFTTKKRKHAESGSVGENSCELPTPPDGYALEFYSSYSTTSEDFKHARRNPEILMVHLNNF